MSVKSVGNYDLLYVYYVDILVLYKFISGFLKNCCKNVFFMYSADIFLYKENEMSLFSHNTMEDSKHKYSIFN